MTLALFQTKISFPLLQTKPEAEVNQRLQSVLYYIKFWSNFPALFCLTFPFELGNKIRLLIALFL